jgi:putative flippase GtrA
MTSGPLLPVRKLLRRPTPGGGGLLHWIHSFTLHVATGFLAVAAHYSVMYVFVRAGVAGVPASAIGFVAGALTRFALSYWHVFYPSRGVKVASVRFVLVILVQLAANSALLAGLLELGVSLWPAQVATTIALTFANYLAYRLWVFR